MNDTMILGALGLIGSLIAILTPIIKLNTKIVQLIVKVDHLEESVRKHNHVVERTGQLERDLKTAFVRIDETREEVKELRNKEVRI